MLPNQFNTSLWGDEAFSAVLSMKPIPEIISIISRDTSPPLYNILEHFWFNLFGTSEVAIRALSFLFFLIASAFVYKIGALLWDRKTGFLASILSFLNPFLFTYAFEGRMYSLLLATVTASFYFFLKNFGQGPISLWLRVGYVFTTTLALYSHHFSIFAIFIQGLWLLHQLIIGNWKLVIPMLRAFALVALAYSPWLPSLYNQTKMVASGFWLATPTFIDLRNLIYKYLAEGINSTYSSFQLSQVILIPQNTIFDKVRGILGISHRFSQLALLVAFISLLARNWLKDLSKATFLLLWFLGPILATFLLSQKFQSIFFDRYLLYTIPAAMLIIASQTTKVSKAALFFLIFLFLAIDATYFTHPTKRPFAEFANYIKEVKRGDDFLVNWNSSAHHLWESKYYGLSAPLFVAPGRDLPFFVGTALMEEGDIIREIPTRVDKIKINRVGVITSGDPAETVLPGYVQSQVKTFEPLKFIWLQK